MATTTRQRELIETEQTLGFPLLGYTIVPYLKGTEISHQDALVIIKPVLESFGLVSKNPRKPKELPGLPEPTLETCLERAVRKWMRDMSKADLGADDDDRIKVRPITKRGSKEDWIVLALVVESSDLAQWGLSFLTSLRIFYNTKNQTLHLTRTDLGAIDQVVSDQNLLDTLLPYWKRYWNIEEDMPNVYTTVELQRMINEIVSKINSSAMREKGGTYFVPRGHETEIQRLKDLIELELPAAPGQRNASSLSAFPMINTKQTKSHMAALAHKSFVADLATLKTDLARFEEQIKKTSKTFKNGHVHRGRVKEETIVARLQQYKDMKNKIVLYQETLGMRQEELVAQLDDLTTTANSLRETATDIMAEQMDGQEEITVTDDGQPRHEESPLDENEPIGA